MRYPTLREVIETTIRHREGCGFSYSKGALHAAIDAAEDAENLEAAIAAIECVLKSREQANGNKT